MTGDIEKYGSGYIRIREAIASYPNMKFEFEEMGNGYLVTLSHEIIEGVTEGVTESQKQLLILIAKAPGLRTTQLSMKLNVPVKTLERWLKTLRDKKIIEFRGAPKTGGYYITTNHEEK